LDKQSLTTTLTTLADFGVSGFDHETGAITCRRMIRDEEIREMRISAGKKGGNPALLNQKSTTGDNQKPTPSARAHPEGEGEDEDEDEDEGVNGIEKVLKPRKAFVKPTQGEVKEYCRSLGLTDNDAVAFWEGKEANGWRNGSTKIKDWQATIRSWKANRYHPSQKQGASTKATFVDRNAGTLNAKVTGYEGL
jgi:hypothetical protein